MASNADAIQLNTRSGGVEFPVKVVPGSSRNAIVGVLGDALKVAVAAPPEAGKANAALTQTIAAALDVKPAMVSIVAGHSQPRKRVEVSGLTVDDVRRRLADALR